MREDLPAWAYALAARAMGWGWAVSYEHRRFVSFFKLAEFNAVMVTTRRVSFGKLSGVTA